MTDCRCNQTCYCVGPQCTYRSDSTEFAEAVWNGLVGSNSSLFTCRLAADFFFFLKKHLFIHSLQEYNQVSTSLDPD